MAERNGRPFGSEMKNFNLANCLTGMRLVGAVILLFLTPLGLPFYIVYSLCGITDALDGPIARRTGKAGEFGAKLDSISDLTFYAVVLCRLLPLLWKALPNWIWYGVGGVIALRIVAYATAAIKFHRFAAIHTWLNKGTSLLLFGVPYLLTTGVFTAYCVGLSIVSFLASGEEFIIHLTAKAYVPERKSLFGSWEPKPL